jgi:hypothetical protein
LTAAFCISRLVTTHYVSWKEILKERNVVREREDECKSGYNDGRNKAFLNLVQSLQWDKIMEIQRK